MANPAPTAPAQPAASGNTTGTIVDPFRAYNFKLNIQGVNQGHFTECTGLGTKIQSIAYREAGANEVIRRLPGQVDYGDVTLRYGLTTSIEMWQWFLSAVKGLVQRRDISVIMLDDTGQEALRWNLSRAWVSEWRGAPLNAMGSEVAIETMVLVFEGMERG
jgi:phage tail-like protein